MRYDTETHNGSGFVKFKSPEVAQNLIQESKRIEEADPLQTSSGISDINLEIGGRRVHVFPALARTDLTKVQESRKHDDTHAPKNKNHIDYWIYNDKA